MKQILSKHKLWLLAIILALPFLVQAESIEETIITVRSYRVEPDAKLEVFNKYGTIHVNTWNTDSLVIRASQYFKAGDKKQLDKLKNTVKLNITKTQYIVNVKTIYQDPTKDILSFIPFDLNSGTESKVDLEVWMPESMNLTLEHRYGDVFIGSLTGDAYIDVSHGQFKAYNMYGKLKLDASYCNSTIRYAENAIIATKFGDLSLDSAGKVNLESRSADVIIGNAELLEIDGKNDDILIRACNELHLDGYFSKVNADVITGSIYSKTTYGNLTVNLSDSYSSSVTLFSNYTDLSLTFDGEAGMLPISVLHQKSRFMYSTSNTDITEEKISGKDVIYKSTGSIGSGKMLTGNVNIEMYSGELKLIVK